MAALSNQTHALSETNMADCQFSVLHIDTNKSWNKKKRRKRSSDNAENGSDDIPVQVSPFTLSAAFSSFNSMDIHYKVEPKKTWCNMRRYNSFVLNDCKYLIDDYVLVSNENSLDYQRSSANKGEEWVARILEVRASDERHVYARVCWMYSPDELPECNDNCGKKIQGRQPYHGKDELIASNHMDIINVQSVTQKATVNQFVDDNDDQVQSALYWRQAFNIQDQEVSAVRRFCMCKQPENPDRQMIECPACKEWLHEECLMDQFLKETCKTLGIRKNHKVTGRERKALGDWRSTASVRKVGRGRKHEGRYDVSLIVDENVFRITEQRAGCKKSWTEELKCILCNSHIH
ncbi:hypothetical protein F5883DRAFT_592157 [Diaporthe sp. PMI_573]|nr:hypothetical protein F5883DRAFT_592157 [Diaporthaceae sp. PMI_573]